MRKFLLSALIYAITIQGMELSTVKQRKSEVPRTLSALKHYDVPINKSKNKFLLNLAHNNPYVSINYLWDGKSVARFIAVDQKMFLESLNPEGYNFSITTPIKTGDFNINLYGKIRFQELVNVDGIASIKCKSLKNQNTFSAQQLCFNGHGIVNNGSINTGRCAIEKCGTIVNKNNWIVDENCYLNDVEKLLAGRNSSWLVGGCWSGNFKSLHLDGNLSVGIAALFSVESGAYFNGFFDVPILYAESKGTFESSSQSKFMVGHHLGLKAKDSIVWEGDILDKSGKKLVLPKGDLSRLNKLPKKGIYLQSDEGSLSKSGIIEVADKPVFLIAKKDLYHDRLTRTKESEHGVIVLAGEHIDLGKLSQLEGYAAQLNAQESIAYNGKTVVESCPQIHDASKDAIDSAGALALNAKKINTAKESQVNAKKVYIIAQDIIDQQGTIKVQEDLSQTASVIEMGKTSSIIAKNAFIHGTEKVSQNGKLTARKALIMRSKKLYNAGNIKAEYSHFKADRWWLNRGIINISDASQIDALLSMNVYPGTIHTKTLTTNALGDLNLGFYKTQKADTNTILSFNAGEYLLPINFEGMVTNDKLKAAAEQSFLLMLPPNIQAYYRLGKFVLNLGFTFDAGGKLYRDWTQLPKAYSGASDLMPLLAGSFNFALSSFQQINSAKNSFYYIQSLYKNVDGNSSASGDKNSVLNIFDSAKILQSIAAPFLPNQNFKAFVNVNLGTIQGVNGQFTNIFDVNAGQLLFTNNYGLNTYTGINEGIAGALNVSVSAMRDYNAGEKSLIVSMETSLEAPYLTLKNHLNAIIASIRAKRKASIGGNISALSKINIMAPEIALKEQCQLRAEQGPIFATANHIESAGDVSGQLVHMQAKYLVLKEGSKTLGHGEQALVVMQAGDNLTAENGSNVCSAGNHSQDKSSNQIVLLAKNADLQEGSNFDAGKGSLKVLAENIKHAATIDGQQIHMQAKDIMLKEGSKTLGHGEQALVVIQAEDNLRSEKDSKVIVSGDDDPKIILHGGKKTDLQKGSYFDSHDGVTVITGGDATLAATMKGAVQTQTKNLVIEKDHGIISSNLRAVAEEKINQKGNLNADELFMRAKFVENCGKINTKKGSIKADRWYWNTGHVISENSLDIVAPVSINWMSFTQAKHLTTDALLDINLLSTDVTQKSDNKALLNLDFSLHLPLLTGDMISEESLKEAGKKALLFAIPAPIKFIYKVIAMAARIPTMKSDACDLCNAVRELYKNPNAGASDWVPLINRAVTLALSSKQMAGQMQEMYSEYKELVPGVAPSNDTVSSVQNSNENKSSGGTDAQVPLITHTSKGININLTTFKNFKEAVAVGASIGGALINQHHNRQSLADFNYGMAIGVNGSSVNLWDTNTAKFFANYHLDTCYGQNLGILAACNLSINAKNYKNGVSGNVGGHQVESSVCIAGLNLAIKADSFNGSSRSVIATTNGASLEVKELDNKGTTHGNLNLKFNGKPEQLKNIGTVKTHGGSFSYQGTIANCDGTKVPSADELARGSGAWGTVSDASAIKFDAGKQDIHIKQQHDMPHALHAKTAGNIDVDQAMSSQGSIGLHTGQNLKHDSLVAKEHIQRIAEKGNITVNSTVERSQDGVNYQDKVNQRSVIAGKSNTAYAGNNIIQTAVEIKSGKEGVVLVAKGDIVDDNLMREKHIEKRDATKSIKDTHISSHVSTYGSDGKLIIHAGGKYIANAAVYNAKDNEKSIGGLKGTEINDVKEIHVHESTKKSEGWWSSEKTQEKTASFRSIGPTFAGHETPFVVGSGVQETVLVNPQSDVRLVLKGESAKVLLGENKTVSVKESAYANVIYESEESQPREELTYANAQVPGIENRTKLLLIESVKGKTCDFLNRIDNASEGEISQSFVEEHRYNDAHSSRRLTSGARVVLGLSIGLLTQGIGTTIAAGLTSMGMGSGISTVLSHMTTGSINHLLNKAANTLVETNGDINRAAERMASYQTLQEVTFAALSAGAISGADQTAHSLGMPLVQEGQNLLQRFEYAVPRELMHAGIKTGLFVLAGQSVGHVLPEQVQNFVTRTLHTALVSQIADLYATESINSTTHKILHGIAAGAVYGSATGEMRTALAASLGAFSAEIASELLAPSKAIMNTIIKFDSDGHGLTQEEFMTAYGQAMQDYMNRVCSAQQIGQLTAAVMALAAGQNVDVAHQAAVTALDNNFLVLALYGITAASTAYSGYKIYKSYQEEGAVGAIKQLGIEIAYNAAGQAVARAGGMMYPSVKAAVVAVLDEAPALKLALGNVAENLIVAAEKINQTAIGKALSKVEAALLEKEAKLLGRFGLNSVASAEKELAQEEFAAAEEMVLADIGIKIRVDKEAQKEIAVFSKVTEARKDIPKVSASSESLTNNISKKLEWTNHGFKHFSPKGLSWKEIVKSTASGHAKYKPDIHVEEIERYAWDHGILVTSNKTWKVLEFDKIIGAKSGIETRYIRVECSANTIHGHPITFNEFKKYLK